MKDTCTSINRRIFVLIIFSIFFLQQTHNIEFTYPCTLPNEHEFNDFCYSSTRELSSLVYTHLEAEEFCHNYFIDTTGSNQERIGHLVSIHSQEEYDLVIKIHESYGDEHYTGLKKNVNVDNTWNGIDYRWIDGTKVDWSIDNVVDNNDNDPPQVQTQICYRLFYSSGKLTDTECDNQKYGICKYKIPRCFGVLGNNKSLVCSGHGFCADDNQCECQMNYTGMDCGNKVGIKVILIVSTVGVGVFMVVFVGCIIVGLIMFYRKKNSGKKFSKIDEGFESNCTDESIKCSIGGSPSEKDDDLKDLTISRPKSVKIINNPYQNQNQNNNNDNQSVELSISGPLKVKRESRKPKSFIQKGRKPKRPMSVKMNRERRKSSSSVDVVKFTRNEKRRVLANALEKRKSHDYNQNYQMMEEKEDKPKKKGFLEKLKSIKLSTTETMANSSLMDEFTSTELTDEELIKREEKNIAKESKKLKKQEEKLQKKIEDLENPENRKSFMKKVGESLSKVGDTIGESLSKVGDTLGELKNIKLSTEDALAELKLDDFRSTSELTEEKVLAKETKKIQKAEERLHKEEERLLKEERKIYGDVFDTSKIRDIKNSLITDQVKVTNDIYRGKLASNTVLIRWYRNIQDESLHSKVKSELVTFNSLRNNFTVKYYGLIIENTSIGLVYENIGTINIRQFSRKYNIPFDVKTRVLLNLTKGLKSMHLSKYFHGDLKIINLFMNSNDKEDLKPRIFFGMNKILKRNLKNDYYCSPEIITRYLRDNTVEYRNITDLGSDVFAFSMVVYEYISGYGPFKNKEEVAIKLSKSAKFRPSLKPLQKYPSWVFGLIKKLWAPTDRPSFTKISSIIETIVNT